MNGMALGLPPLSRLGQTCHDVPGQASSQPLACRFLPWVGDQADDDLQTPAMSGH